MASDKELKIKFLGWNELHRILLDLAIRIRNSNMEFDTIYAIMKGGLIPARILMDLLNIDELGIIGVKFYKSVGLRGKKPIITQPPTISVTGKRVLIVDDVVDTGKTLQLVMEELTRYNAEKIVSLAIYVKPWAMITPDLYYGVTDKWVVFPWEIRETITEGIDLRKYVNDPIMLEVVKDSIKLLLKSKTSYSI